MRCFLLLTAGHLQLLAAAACRVRTRSTVIGFSDVFTPRTRVFSNMFSVFCFNGTNPGRIRYGIGRNDVRKHGGVNREEKRGICRDARKCYYGRRERYTSRKNEYGYNRDDVRDRFSVRSDYETIRENFQGTNRLIGRENSRDGDEVCGNFLRNPVVRPAGGGCRVSKNSQQRGEVM